MEPTLTDGQRAMLVEALTFFDMSDGLIDDVVEQLAPVVAHLARTQYGEGYHAGAMSVRRATFRRCHDRDGIDHICGDPEGCEESDDRPRVDLLG